MESSKVQLKSDSSDKQKVYFVRGLYRSQERLYDVVCLRGWLLERSPTLANLEYDPEFISKEYILVDMKVDNIILLWRFVIIPSVKLGEFCWKFIWTFVVLAGLGFNGWFD